MNKTTYQNSTEIESTCFPCDVISPIRQLKESYRRKCLYTRHCKVSRLTSITLIDHSIIRLMLLRVIRASIYVNKAVITPTRRNATLLSTFAAQKRSAFDASCTHVVVVFFACCRNNAC